MKVFRVTGTYMENKKTMKFSKDIAATSSHKAKDIAFSMIGSYHKIKRRNIKIEEILEVTETTDPLALYKHTHHGEK